MTARSLGDAEPRLQRVGRHIAELRRAGRDEDAEAVGFVRDLAEAALRGLREGEHRELLTTGEAALALGLSNQTVRNWVAAGRLPAVRRGVRTMVPRAAVADEIERSRARPGEASATPVSVDATVAARRDLLAALPRDTVARLTHLHDKQEEGQVLTTAEAAEMARLEQDMADAAARHLRRVIRRGRAGAA